MKNFVISLLFCATSFAGTKSVTLLWDQPDPSEAVTQYYLYELVGGTTVWYGSQRVNGVYTKNGVWTKGYVFTVTIDVDDTVPHTFYLMAQNAYGFSNFSNPCVVPVTTTTTRPTMPQNLRETLDPEQ